MKFDSPKMESKTLSVRLRLKDRWNGDLSKKESIALLSLQLASYGGFIKDKSAGAQRSTMKKFLRNPPWGFFS